MYWPWLTSPLTPFIHHCMVPFRDHTLSLEPFHVESTHPFLRRFALDPQKPKHQTVTGHLISRSPFSVVGVFSLLPGGDQAHGRGGCGHPPGVCASESERRAASARAGERSGRWAAGTVCERRRRRAKGRAASKLEASKLRAMVENR